MKSGRFHHEIWWISPWNPVNFTMKSSRFHEIHEIQWISPWNLADFMKSGRFQVKSDVSEIRCRRFSKNSSDWSFESRKTYTWSSQKAHIPWNLVDFMKSDGFHEIQWISYRFYMDFIKTGGFHMDFTLKSGGFHHEIQWISWNQGDFRWNPVDFTQISPVKSTQNYKSKCFSKNSLVWWMQGGGLWPRISWNPPYFTWNLVDFTHEIWQISPRFDLWNPPKL